MSELAEVISGEFEEALEVKNPKSLQRGIYLLLSSSVQKEEYIHEKNDIRSSIELIAQRMEEGFKRIDQRFEAIDKRFEAIDKRFEVVDRRFEAVNRRFEAVDKKFEGIQHQMDNRFNKQTALITIGFVVVTTLITVYQFLA